ncbi:MAG TPA: M23 family metallopeptidase, partial [Methylomirabilota bacterium]
PAVTIVRPGEVMGRSGAIEVLVETPGGEQSRLDIFYEQEGNRRPLFTLDQQAGSTLAQETSDRLRVTLPATPREIPDMKSGPARIVVDAARRTLRDLRTLETNATREVRVQLEPPRLAVLSTHHYINHGGSEFVVLRVTPAEAAAGVRVGDVEYPSFPGSAVGISGAGVRVAFYALLHDQDLNAPMSVFARDEAGNTASAPITSRVFPKAFRRSRIEVPDSFLQRVVPAILENTPSFSADTSTPEALVAAYVRINSELRKQNADQIAAFAKETVPEMLWRGPFQQLGGSQVESAFADHRTYFHDGEEIDQQVHLGFDLAVTAAVPVLAAARGRVVHAGYLGIYGNCVILDHGLGVQSLYAHLSSIDVQTGDQLDQGATLGRSGMTGLAGGDHLHYSMLVNGRFVTPVEWWDTKWMQDRVFRKIREAGGTVPG